MNATRKTLTAAVAALTVSTGALATFDSAQAGSRYGRPYHYHRGSSAGPVVAGVIGGLALGALAAAASRPAYAYNQGYAPGYAYEPAYGDGYAASGYADEYAPQCFVQKQNIYDAWGNYAGKRKVRVCQ